MAEYRLRRLSIKTGRPEKLLVLGLLFLFLSTATAGITSVLVNPNWGMLWRGLFLGLLLGWGLASLKQPGWLSGFLVVILSMFYTLLFGGGLEQKFISILIQLSDKPFRLIFFPEDYQVEITSLGQQLTGFLHDVIAIIERVANWIWTLFAGQAEFDPLATSLTWSIIFWMVAAWTGWAVIRYRNSLAALLPAVFLSVGVLSYSHKVSFSIYILLGLMLLLMAIVHYERREQEWDQTGIAYPSKKGLHIKSASLLLTIGLVILSSVLSSFSIARIREWVSLLNENVPQQEGNLADYMGIISSVTSTPDLFENTRSPGLPSAMLIGSGPELSRRIVMTIEVEGFPKNFSREERIQFYWGSYTFDIYTGHGWRTSQTILDEHSPNQPIQPEGNLHRLPIKQIVRSASNPLNSLYTAGIPIRVNQSSTAAWRSSGDLFGVQITPTRNYVADSQLLRVDADTLRNAGQQYPEWVKDHYLSIPRELPERVKGLALQLTASEPTPYDRTRAIERYLRDIPYSLDVPLPPLDQDLVDFFLFDLRRGYCDYYASAMVILLRTAGIPSRIATGYAAGTYNLNTNRFIVSEADAHTWVEVYFPNAGWIPFEPTGSRPTLEPSQTSSISDHNELRQLDNVTDRNSPNSNNRIWLAFLVVIALIMISSLVFIVQDEVRLSTLPERGIAIVVYNRMRNYARHMGTTHEPGETPYEFAASLASQILQHSRNRNGSSLRVNCARYVNSLVERIVQVSYQPDPFQVRDKENKENIYHQWRTLRWLLRLVWLQARYETWRDRIDDLFNFDHTHKYTRPNQEI